MSIALLGILFPVFLHAQAPEDKKATIQQQMDALQKEIDELDGELDKTHQEKETLARQIEIFDNEIKKRKLEMRKISLAIAKADEEINHKDSDIAVFSEKIEKLRINLRENLAALQRYQQSSILEALLAYASLSQLFDSITNLENIQSEIQLSLADLRDTREQTERARDDLEEFKVEQANLRALQEVERQTIERNKKQKDEILRLTKGKEALFQSIITEKKKSLAALKSQLFYLEQTGISVEDALTYARLAADRAGIRVEFLLALLEVETGRQFADGALSIGTNLGTGNWRDDLYGCYQRLGQYYARYYGDRSYITKYNARAENEKIAFFRITEELGFDPDKMPVSKEPRYIGCGGAMGPAQFLPSTWLLFKKKVEELTNHAPANPWNIEDAFTASAVFLADAGAGSKTEAGESRAARTYISGRSTCGSAACNSYARQIADLTKEIARNID